jgi:hypothetical protein
MCEPTAELPGGHRAGGSSDAVPGGPAHLGSVRRSREGLRSGRAGDAGGRNARELLEPTAGGERGAAKGGTLARVTHTGETKAGIRRSATLNQLRSPTRRVGTHVAIHCD